MFMSDWGQQLAMFLSSQLSRSFPLHILSTCELVSRKPVHGEVSAETAAGNGDSMATRYRLFYRSRFATCFASRSGPTLSDASFNGPLIWVEDVAGFRMQLQTRSRWEQLTNKQTPLKSDENFHQWQKFVFQPSTSVFSSSCADRQVRWCHS